MGSSPSLHLPRPLTPLTSSSGLPFSQPVLPVSTETSLRCLCKVPPHLYLTPTHPFNFKAILSAMVLTSTTPLRYIRWLICLLFQSTLSSFKAGLFIFFIFKSEYVCACKYSVRRGKKSTWRSPRAGVTGDCEPPDVSAGTELRSYVHLTTSHLSSPQNWNKFVLNALVSTAEKLVVPVMAVTGACCDFLERLPTLHPLAYSTDYSIL